MKTGIAGSLESCDCRVRATLASTPSIVIDSVVDVFFHDQILAAVSRAVDRLGGGPYTILVEDKGAFDFAIEARVEAAIRRCHQ
jgi:citrate lyase acyl carrier protein